MTRSPLTSPDRWLVVMVPFGLAAMLTICGCHKDGASGQASEAERVKSIRQAFAKSSPDVKAAAEEAAAGLESADTGRAFLQLNLLSSRPDLTAEQRGVTAESMLTAATRLREAAAKGDRDAAKLLEDYRATK